MKTLLMLFSALSLVCGQANTWVKVPGQSTLRASCALVYYPDSNRFLLTMGMHPNLNHTYDSIPYDVQMFSIPQNRWINFLPAAELYGVWADSTGFTRGAGQVSAIGTYYFGFKYVPYNGHSYLRPNISSMTMYTGAYNQYAYDSHAQKAYYYIWNTLFTYDMRTRLWDTLSVPTDPARAVGSTQHLRWGSLCYDPVNREIVLFGGGNIDIDRGNLGTWVYSTQTNTWTKITSLPQPDPRCLSPMVYDPASQCIVVFGGDHLDHLMSDTWVYHCATRSWEKKSPALAPAPRAGHAMLYLPKSGKIVMMGGFDYVSEPVGYMANHYQMRERLELWTYDVASDEWKAVKGWISAGEGCPKVFRPLASMAAVDTGDNLLVLAEDTTNWYSYLRETFTMQCDPSARDTALERTAGVAANMETWRTGGWDPAWYSQNVPAVDTAATEDFLRTLPAAAWSQVTMPKAHTFAEFTWGTSRYDPVNDVVLSFNGGHSSYSGNQVLQYSVHANRMSVGYQAEVPLECQFANTDWPTCPTFNNRPFMYGHIYSSYNVCAALGRMVLASGRFSYLYDPARQDWDSARISNPYEIGRNVHSTFMIKADRGLLCWADQKVFRLDTLARTWVEIPLTGAMLPMGWCEMGGAIYDPVRNRLVIVVANSSGPVDVYSCDFGTGVAAKLSPTNAAVTDGAYYVREAAYLHDSDGMLLQTIVNGKHLFFNFATDDWELVTIGNIPSLTDNSTGMMYDENRDLVYIYNPNTAKNRLYVLKPDSLQFTSDPEKAVEPAEAALTACPNPFNPTLTLRLPAKAGSLKIYSVTGRLIADLSAQAALNRTVSWKPASLPAGIYVVKYAVGNRSRTMKTVLAK